MLLQISTLKFWINFESSDYFHLIGTARGGRSLPRERVRLLLDRAVNSQSQPKLDKVADFWKSAHQRNDYP